MLTQGLSLAYMSRATGTILLGLCERASRLTYIRKEIHMQLVRELTFTESELELIYYSLSSHGYKYAYADHVDELREKVNWLLNHPPIRSHHIYTDTYTD